MDMMKLRGSGALRVKDGDGLRNGMSILYTLLSDASC